MPSDVEKEALLSRVRFPFSNYVLFALCLCWHFHACVAQSTAINTTSNSSTPSLANPACVVNLGTTRIGGAFAFSAWWDQGRCVKNTDHNAQCSATLAFVLDNLDSLHQAEYSAAATILTLIPTIGALFGTPTSEIWVLLKLLPIGGFLAMFLSFGGTLMPRSLDDFRAERERGSEKGPAGAETAKDVEKARVQGQLDLLARRIKTKVRGNNRMALPLIKIVAALFGMIILLASVLAGIAIVAIGAVYVTWCTATWWFHLWYLVGRSFAFFTIPIRDFVKAREACMI